MPREKASNRLRVKKRKRNKIKQHQQQQQQRRWQRQRQKRTDKIDHQLAFMLLFGCRNKSSIFSVSLQFKSWFKWRQRAQSIESKRALTLMKRKYIRSKSYIWNCKWKKREKREKTHKWKRRNCVHNWCGQTQVVNFEFLLYSSFVGCCVESYVTSQQ